MGVNLTLRRIYYMEDSVGECAFGAFRHGSRCKVEASEVRDAGGAGRGAVQPGIGADEVDGGGGQDAGEVGLGLSAVGSAAQPGAADGLGDGALDAGADVVSLLPLVGLLFATSLIEDLLLRLGQEGEAAAVSAVRGLGALRSQRARTAVLEREVHAGDRGAGGFALVGPADADRSVRAGDSPVVPVDVEGALGDVAALVTLVDRVRSDGTEQVDPVFSRAVTMWAAVM